MRETILIREQYKVTTVLFAQEGYTALLAVDIKSREKIEYLLNVYEGTALRRYLPIYQQMGLCAQKKETFLSAESFVSVFSLHKGVEIDKVFYDGASLTWQQQLEAMGQLLHLALVESSRPPEVSCMAFFSENLFYDAKEKLFSVRRMIVPTNGLNQRELMALVADQMQKIIIRRFGSLEQERLFMDKACSGGFQSIPALYGGWQSAEKSIREECETFEQMSWFQQIITKIKINFKYRKRKGVRQ